jgi:hypothetical protein
MFRIPLLTVTLAIGIGFLPAPSAAQSFPIRGAVELRTDRSLDEIAEYVETVDRRLYAGRYDRSESADRTWMIRQIARLESELEAARAGGGLSPALQVLAGEFEMGVIRIEEGSIICRNEFRTGTRHREDRCYTEKRIREDEERSRDTLRKWKRPQAIGGNGNGAAS